MHGDVKGVMLPKNILESVRGTFIHDPDTHQILVESIAGVIGIDVNPKTDTLKGIGLNYAQFCTPSIFPKSRASSLFRGVTGMSDTPNTLYKFSRRIT